MKKTYKVNQLGDEYVFDNMQDAADFAEVMATHSTRPEWTVRIDIVVANEAVDGTDNG